ncbi:unnamed protein product [Prorocentrum cordatum]|uniref:Nuclear pore complex protein n=1 Tax=Prorocentrum cordatum TaxID=2364126 RepID=A0ABN9SBE7_9DINO|nr:unnamed protein product [Polarella glacialis]
MASCLVAPRTCLQAARAQLEDLDAYARWLHCLLSVFLKDSEPTAGLGYGVDLLGVASYQGSVPKIQDLLVHVRRSPHCHMYLYMLGSNGGEVLAYVRKLLSDQCQREPCAARAEEILAKAAAPGPEAVEKLVQLDAELTSMSYQVEPAVIANTKYILHMCIRNKAIGGEPVGKEETTAGINDPLAAMQGLKYFEHVRDPDSENDRVALRMWTIASECRLQLLRPEFKTNDVEALEGVAMNIALTAPVRPGGNLHVRCSSLGSPMDLFLKAAEVGSKQLALRGGATLAPKCDDVTRTIKSDAEYWKYWKAAFGPDNDAKFSDDHGDRSCAFVATLREEREESIVRGRARVDEISSMLVASGKSDSAVGLRVYWHMSLTRFTCALLAVQFGGVAFSGSDCMTDNVVGSWNGLARQVVDLERLKFSQNLDPGIMQMKTLEAHGFPAVPGELVRSELDVIEGRCADLLTAVASRASTQLQRELLATKFDTEKCIDIFVDETWEGYASAWVNVAKKQTSSKALSSPAIGGSFEQLCPSCIAVCERVLSAGKRFISVAYTVRFILAVLPAEPRNGRLAKIDAELAKVKGADPPRSLHDYLRREKGELRAADSKEHPKDSYTGTA